MNIFSTFEELDESRKQVKTWSNELRPYIQNVKLREEDDTCWQQLGKKLLMMEETCDDEIINAVYADLSVYPEFDEYCDGSEATIHDRWEMNAWVEYTAARFHLAKIKYISFVSQLQGAKG